jgi:hypothetical protein
MIALWITAFFGLTAIGVDVARISYTASEVQSAADIAATVGAAALINGRTASTDVAALLGSNNGTSNNTIDNKTATSALDSSPTLEPGTVDSSGAFTPDTGSPPNAADNALRATCVATVGNLFSGVFGSGSTQITKVALAALETTSQGRPEIPLAVADGCFQAQNCSANDCPILSTKLNTAGWTAYSGSADDQTIRPMVPNAPGCTNGGATEPILNVNDTVNLTNGTLSNVYRDVFCLYCADPSREYLVTVVNLACGAAFNVSSAVTGFATIKITGFTDSGGAPVLCSDKNPSPKDIVIQSLRRADESGGVGGCVKCGSGSIRLIG